MTICVFAPEVVDTSEAGEFPASALALAVEVATGGTVVVLGAALVALGDATELDLGAN